MASIQPDQGLFKALYDAFLHFNKLLDTYLPICKWTFEHLIQRPAS